MPHADVVALATRQKGGGQTGRFEIRAAQLQFAGEHPPVDIVEQRFSGRRPRRQCAPPDRQPFLRAGRHKVDDEAQAAQEGGVQIGFAVGGQGGDAVEPLDALQQVVDLDIGEAVVAVLYLHAAAEQRVGLVEEQHHSCAFAECEHDTSRRRFSVSPTYLLTTPARSTR